MSTNFYKIKLIESSSIKNITSTFKNIEDKNRSSKLPKQLVNNLLSLRDKIQDSSSYHDIYLLQLLDDFEDEIINSNTEDLYKFDKYNHMNLERSYRFCHSLFGYRLEDKEYITVLSLENSFDLILHLMLGCDINNIRKMKNYTRISKTFTNFLIEDFKYIYIRDLEGYDEHLDNYINNLKIKSASQTEFILNFIADLNAKMKEVLYIISSDIVHTYRNLEEYHDLPTNGISVKYLSRGYSTMLFRMFAKADDIVMTRYDYPIKLKSYTDKELTSKLLNGGYLV